MKFFFFKKKRKKKKRKKKILLVTHPSNHSQPCAWHSPKLYWWHSFELPRQCFRVSQLGWNYDSFWTYFIGKKKKSKWKEILTFDSHSLRDDIWEQKSTASSSESQEARVFMAQLGSNSQNSCLGKSQRKFEVS